MSLRATLAGLCAKCSHVAIAWCAPNAAGFAVQGIVGTRRRPDPNNRGSMVVETTYPATTAEATRELVALVAAIGERHPRVSAHLVSYTFRPGPSWVVAYRRPT